MTNEMNKMMENDLENVSGGVDLPSQYHVVQAGETLSGIAVQYRTTVKKLLYMNPRITDADLIYAGEVIRIL